MIKHSLQITVFSFLSFLLGCGDNTMTNLSTNLQSNTISAKDWDTLSKKKIYFGHMSVGYNIIDGIKDIMKINPNIKLNIHETTDIINVNNGIFAHSKNGENIKLKTKVDAFIKTMDNGLGKKVNIAFFKFCYMDIDDTTDVNDIFNYYKSSMVALKNKYPHVAFLHMTVPLTSEGGLLGLKIKIKDFIKNFPGRPAKEKQNAISNIKRNEFNTLLRKEFNKEYIIDLEEFESTNIDGKRCVSKKGGAKDYYMAPAYTFDGGHLNQLGRMLVADKILAQLAGIKL